MNGATTGFQAPKPFRLEKTPWVEPSFLTPHEHEVERLKMGGSWLQISSRKVLVVIIEIVTRLYNQRSMHPDVSIVDHYPETKCSFFSTSFWKSSNLGLIQHLIQPNQFHLAKSPGKLLTPQGCSQENCGRTWMPTAAVYLWRWGDNCATLHLA